MKQDRQGVHFHNCLWASALSGVSGTAMFWWWELLDQQDAYRHYKPLAEFLSDIRPGGPATDDRRDIRVPSANPRTAERNRAYLWLVNRQATWWNLVVEKREPDPIDSAAITLDGLKPGHYTAVWWDTQEGISVARQTVIADDGRLQLTAPSFTRDLACKIAPAAFAE